MDINTTRLRCTIGWLAIALPWLSVLFSMVFSHTIWPQSISITYYEFQTAMPMLMIVLGSASFLLISYKGYSKIDDIINTIAAIFGLLILLFPCFKAGYVICGSFQVPNTVSDTIHMIAAVAFFGLLSFNSLFLFTKSSGKMTKEKKIRNIIYRVCGIGMLASFLLLIPFNLCNVRIGVWIVEAVALAFFGISWLTKADYYPWLFADKKVG